MEKQEWNNWDPQADDYHSLRNNPSLDTDDAGVALVGYKAQDEARICRFFAKSGYCWKDYCTKEHSRPNPGLLRNHISLEVKQTLFWYIPVGLKCVGIEKANTIVSDHTPQYLSCTVLILYYTVLIHGHSTL